MVNGRLVAARVVRTTILPIRYAIMVAVAIAAMHAIPVAAVSAIAVWGVIDDAAREQGAQGDQ